MFKGNGTPSASPLGGFKRIFKKDTPARTPPVVLAAPLPRRASSGAAAPPTEDELHSLFSEARRLLAELSSSEVESSPADQQAAVSELKTAIRRVQAALDRVVVPDEQFVWQQCAPSPRLLACAPLTRAFPDAGTSRR